MTYKLNSDMMVMLAMIRTWKPPPSIGEMEEATSAQSQDTVHHRLKWLEGEGYIETNPGTRRTYVAKQKGLDTFPEFLVIGKRDGQGMRSVVPAR